MLLERAQLLTTGNWVRKFGPGDLFFVLFLGCVNFMVRRFVRDVDKSLTLDNIDRLMGVTSLAVCIEIFICVQS